MATAVESATQISLPVEKEETAEVSAPVANEQPEAEAAVESQAAPEEPAPLEAEAEAETAAEPAQEEPVATTEATEEPAAAVEEEVPVIQQGYLQKRGLKPLRLWKNRYFGFHNEPFALAQLRLVSKKSLKATSAPKEEFEKVNKSLFHNIATATVSGESLMFYFKSSNPDHVEVPLGVINLEDVESVAPAKASKPHAFCIKTNVRDYILAAPTADEAKSWVHTIQQKLDSLSSLSSVVETAQYKETYERLVTRQAFNGKSASTIPTGILSDSEVLSGSDNEKEPETSESKEAEVAETAVEAEASAVEETPVVAETTEEAPKRRSVLGGIKSFIKKEKTSNSSIEVAPVSEEAPEATEEVEVKEASEAVAAEETPAEAPVEEQAAEEVKVEEATEAVEAKVEEVDAKPSRPLSFGIPKFFKSGKKEGQSAEFTEAVESPTEEEPAAEVASPEVSEDAAPEAVVEAEPAEVTTTEAVAEEATEAPEQAAEATSEEPVADAEPGSPIKRTLSNLFRSKKTKNSESQIASVEETTEEPSAAVESPVEAVAEPQEPPKAEAEAESAPAELQAEAAAEEAVDATETPQEAAETTDAEEKPKKPTLFKRMTFMLRSNTGSAVKSTSSTTESIPAATSSPSAEVLTEAPEEVAQVEQKIEAAPEAVKSH
ncbi:hypothetical protein K493DRAFT_108062 [Basidiobolus meristosporus CBS 931.73]|uniref:PH domain-containing protein n=1 Tax=Basidiobolus meristosporus CBS 931.73 TaxID=1314790 RepID=A0A1Y1YP31_9FUNG|nr:hypothetical protein K493DRAFT_108062 [Basidiobolus meristosporus CBS 931.73]|eukprot:ORX99779.1 hypothetical protein K493DRAFT_108062 [Basidiobolus meristosporus CBS 931.73]